ncbi:MAG: hypothetical protein HQL74_06735 [Magnetococcales bacterium]|nr:hypothetical protein [Magnetococcales bacterium]
MKRTMQATLAKAILTTSIVLASWPLTVLAEVPKGIPYQGYLTDTKKKPVDGNVSIQFSLYSAPTGGVALWSETDSVTVTGGWYNIVLGNVTPIALPFDVPYFLGIKVGGDAEMTPRLALSSVGYAMRASVAEGVADKSIKASSIGEKCATGEILKKTDTGWACSADVTLPSGSSMLNWKGTWNAQAAYTPGDLVVNNGSTWVAKAGVTAVAPTTNSQQWDPVPLAGGGSGNGGASFPWKGEWDGTAPYVLGDVVTRNGSSWIAKLGSQNIEPVPGSMYWNVLAAKGSEGAVGPAGPPGQPGPSGPPGPQGVPGLWWKNGWDATVQYNTGDAVAWAGAAWIAKAPSMNNDPMTPNSTVWSLLAAKGMDGTPGTQGPAGSPDTGIQIRDKLQTLVGPNGQGVAGLNADMLDGIHAVDLEPRIKTFKMINQNSDLTIDHLGIVFVSGNTVLNLPPAAPTNAGWTYTIKRTDAGSSQVVINGIVDGQATHTLATQYAAMTVMSNGQNWYTIGESGLDMAPPVVGGSGVVATTLGANSVTLNWASATDNMTQQNGMQYTVYRSTTDNISTVAAAEGNGAVIATLTNGATNYTDTGLSNGTGYYYAVVAKDAAGNKTIYQKAAPFNGVVGGSYWGQFYWGQGNWQAS